MIQISNLVELEEELDLLLAVGPLLAARRHDLVQLLDDGLVRDLGVLVEHLGLLHGAPVHRLPTLAVLVGVLLDGLVTLGLVPLLLLALVLLLLLIAGSLYSDKNMCNASDDYQIYSSLLPSSRTFPSDSFPGRRPKSSH